MKRTRLTLSVTVVVVAIVVFGVGSYILKVNPATAVESQTDTEPNKPSEVKKPAEPNAPEKATEAEKPGEPNEPERERSERRPRPGREGGMGMSSEGGDRTEMTERFRGMRERFENMSEEEREQARAEMQERFGGRGRRGDRGQGGEGGAGGERRPGGRRRPRDPNDPNAPAEPNEPSGPVDPNKIMENMNLKDVQMKDIIKKLAEWTDKVVIPADDAMNQKITIYSTKRLPRTQAIVMIYTALRAKGIVVEDADGVIQLKSIKDAKLGPVPTVQADYALAMIENKKQVVQKFFQLDNYGSAQMGQVVQPLVGDYGYVSADETTGQLLVIDTVENLMRIERIIDQFDVPEAEQSVTQIIHVEFGDPSEIVQMLKILLGESEGFSTMRANRFRSDRDRSSSSSSSSRSRTPSQSGSSKPGDSKGTATSVVIGSTRGPVVLIPETRRKWIIAKASAEDMKQIEEWIRKLDMKDPVASDYEVIQLRYANPIDIEDAVERGFRDMPGMEFLPSVLVESVDQTKQVVIFGRKDLRDLVKNMIAEIDVPPGLFETGHFKLKYADPDQIKANIDELYEEGMQSSSGYRGYGGYNPFSSRSRSSSSTSSEKVKVISYVSLKQVTVIASPENMIKIAEQIEEWDSPLDVNSVKPRIIELRNTDPVQMADLLTSLFSETSSGSGSRGRSIFDLIYGQTEDKQKIVGALYGQLTFEDVPGTKKIIVISKIAEAYDVVEALIRELDKAEMGEIPTVITLKYANPEDLSERLNALFNESGTTATIQRTDRGLSDYSMEADSGSSSSQSGQDTTSQEPYRPWWTTGRQSIDEQPISNVIGRIRFIPDPRTKSLLVLHPPEFLEKIQALIEALDIPGKQVMIKAVIMQIDHSNVTSLGLQLRSGGFSDVGENAITIGNILNVFDERGSFTFDAEMNVTTMVDFLVKKTNAKILNQQTLWTKDNEEAMFFKGKRVAFYTTATSSATAGNVQNFEFQQVGMTLRVRPSITPENNVDMIINVILSQLTADRENSQPVRTEMDTTTNMIIQHAQTLMLGGILFQTDSKVERKVPLLGDMPVAGGLFRHNNIIESNEELIVFITPYVIDKPDDLLPETKAEIEPSLEKLDNIKAELEAILQPAK
ncbi:MAG: secretin N-terminal domain-containing protein [Sedimentisphaerales bacterium]